MRRFLLILSIFGLTACGFHLRSASEIPADLKKIYLETPASEVGFTGQLKNALSGMDVQLATNKNSAPYTVSISNINFRHDTPSILSVSTPTQYTYTYTLTYSIITQTNKVLVPPTTLSTSQQLYAEPNQMLTTNSADKRMKQQLQTEAIDMLINSLTSEGVQKKLKQ